MTPLHAPVHDGQQCRTEDNIEKSQKSKGPAYAHPVNHGNNRCSRSRTEQTPRKVVRRRCSPGFPWVDVDDERIGRVIESNHADSEEKEQHAWHSHGRSEV
ncbi:major facilitator superfamily transporter [Colletotrichum scovillei]|uniref:Major facilitator superfamily transporter n=1 Tax=Colletotrichum scovillei TaxID=1209932 RepID=A0A9P7RIN0_9PEZI|nr:major facilitator superfamily transporter [Colletotrichum scovillei]KAG7075649.1 major facilitator superfamily transporter [Colletotrichum scovillei]KAG7082764.1 major facilitator superfamily transporter [Colletotrichum scovillei]